MSNVKAYWSGCYPCLCFGEWKLEVNGADVSHLIPEDLRSEEMGTSKIYSSWRFNEDFLEEDVYYQDGYGMDEWIEINKHWLNEITEDIEIHREIYEAINDLDWRHGQCGGCI